MRIVIVGATGSVGTSLRLQPSPPGWVDLALLSASTTEPLRERELRTGVGAAA